LLLGTLRNFSGLSWAEGLQLNRSFALIRDPKVRKRILDLVASLAQDPRADPPETSNGS